MSVQLLFFFNENENRFIVFSCFIVFVDLFFSLFFVFADGLILELNTKAI